MATGRDDIDTAGGDDIMADLLSMHLLRRPFDEKMDIVKNDCPMAGHLELHQPAKACYVHHFQVSNRERYTWLRHFAIGLDKCVFTVKQTFEAKVMWYGLIFCSLHFSHAFANVAVVS